MARRVQANFAAGEIDPALHERTNFEKYNSGLKTARNVYVGKTGRIISRQGRKFFIEVKDSGRKCIVYAPPFDDYVIEWGHQYVRIHNVLTGTFSDDAHSLTESDLPYIEFLPSKKWVYVFCRGKEIQKMVLGNLDLFDPYLNTRFLPLSEILYTPAAATNETFLSSTATGPNVEYVVTAVNIDEQETTWDAIITAVGCQLPINVGETTVMRADFTTSAYKMRVYRRPVGGGAFGFVGETTDWVLNLGLRRFTFTDSGVDADYTVQPLGLPVFNTASSVQPKTGAVYQQRLLVANGVTKHFADPTVDEEGIFCSQTNYQNNFHSKPPLSANSALALKAGSSGKAKVLKLIDTVNGLVVFTTVGIFALEGALTPDNLAMIKRGKFVIDDSVSPIEVPGNLVFVDALTNTIRGLLYDDTSKSYPGEELSIFSNHLFVNKRVTSWAFQDGDIPVLWVTQDDGSLLSLTYQREHQMAAWTRHDTDGCEFESVTVQRSLGEKAVAYFVVKRGNKRYIEYTSDRFFDDVKEFVGMDSAVSYNQDYGAAADGAKFNVFPEDPENWEGVLTLTSDLGAFANVAGQGAVGTKWRVFDSQGSACDLEVVEFISAVQLRVQPSVEFNGAESSDIKLYALYQTLTGLSHLEGQEVSVFADGYVLGSPLNDATDYETFVVTSGSITLPKPYAFVHVGLPYMCEVETLDVDTVEQKPVLLDAKIVSQLNIKLHNTCGLYASGVYPVRDIVKGMRDLHYKTEDLEFGNVGNACDQPTTRRESVPIPSDWNSNGRILLRQVDPLPFEILSIVPDYTIV